MGDNIQTNTTWRLTSSLQKKIDKISGGIGIVIPSRTSVSAPALAGARRSPCCSRCAGSGQSHLVTVCCIWMPSDSHRVKIIRAAAGTLDKWRALW